jgi:hypothetical protein
MKQRNLIMKHRFNFFATCLIGCLFSTTGVAAGIAIEPGMWETNMTMKMSMMPQPQVHSSTECIEESELNPEDFNMDENSPCDIGEVVLNDNTVNWAINCPAEGGMALQGNWSMTSNGDTLTGGGSMSGGTEDMQISMTIKWDGKRIGDCD